MADDFLGMFMGNLARAKIVRVFAFSGNEVFTLARLSKRSGVPMQRVIKELRALETSGLIKKGKVTITLPRGTSVTGKQKEQTWTLNQNFKHVSAVTKFVHEVSPVHRQSILSALKLSGRLSAVILSGSFMGDPSRPADLVIVGNSVNEHRLEIAARRLEPQVGREIRYAVLTTPEFRYRLTIQDRLLRETLDYPHIVLLDKAKLLS
jgi:hypothetical protein